MTPELADQVEEVEACGYCGSAGTDEFPLALFSESDNGLVCFDCFIDWVLGT